MFVIEPFLPLWPRPSTIGLEWIGEKVFLCDYLCVKQHSTDLRLHSHELSITC